MNTGTLITGKTSLYGIIGYPVTHSLSPVMQNAALQAGGIDGIYLPFAVAPEKLSMAVDGLRALQVRGFNVTIPHKTAIMPFLDELAPTAQEAGAVNTVVNDNGRLVGHTTDGEGLICSLQRDLDVEVPGTTVLLVGAGGAARGALAALCRSGVRSVRVVNRTAAAAQTLTEQFQERFPAVALHSCVFHDLAPAVLGRCDLVINATSLGMHGEIIPGLDLAHLPDRATVYDMVYAPPVTPLLMQARSRGLQAANGLGMLVAQGERGFQLWHGHQPTAGCMKTSLTEYLSHLAKP